MIEQNFNLVRDDAKSQNRWLLVAICWSSDVEGFVMFTRPRIEDPEITFGTAAFYLPDDTINEKCTFTTGHYDLNEREAREDLATRFQRGI